MANQFTKVKLHIKNIDDIKSNYILSKEITKAVADIIKTKLPTNEITLDTLIKGIEEKL